MFCVHLMSHLAESEGWSQHLNLSKHVRAEGPSRRLIKEGCPRKKLRSASRKWFWQVMPWISLHYVRCRRFTTPWSPGSASQIGGMQLTSMRSYLRIVLVRKVRTPHSRCFLPKGRHPSIGLRWSELDIYSITMAATLLPSSSKVCPGRKTCRMSVSVADLPNDSEK